VHRIDWRWLEIEVQVEPPGFLVKRMNQQCAHTNDFSRLRGAEERVLEERLAETSTFFRLVDSQTSQKNYTDGMIGKALGDPLRRITTANTGRSERVIAGDPLGAAGDVGLGGVGLLILPSIPCQPLIERWFSAIEARQIMVA